MSTVQRALNWAVKMGHMERSPLAGVEKPAETRRETYLWPEQYQEVVSLIRDEPFRDYVDNRLPATSLVRVSDLGMLPYM